MISILSVFPPFRGGIATFSDYLYRSLKKKGPVQAFNYSKLYPSILFPGKTQFNGDLDHDYTERILHAYNPLNWKNAATEILKTDPTHLIICYWHPFFAPALLRILHHIKKVQPQIHVSILVHNVVPHENFPFGRLLSLKLLNKADKVILLSDNSFQKANQIGVQSQLTTLFHPVYEQPSPTENRDTLRKRYGFTPEDRIFLFFGLIRDYKGLDLFIEALNNIDIEKFNLKPLIVGEFYTDKEKLLSQIKPEHKRFYTIIDRFITDDEVADFFTISDALVMPYRSASQSGILANAINFKLPAIVSDLPGLTEHVIHSETAWIFKKNNTKELQFAIESLTNPELLQHISTNLEGLKTHLSWNHFTDRLLEEIR